MPLQHDPYFMIRRALAEWRARDRARRDYIARHTLSYPDAARIVEVQRAHRDDDDGTGIEHSG